MPGGLCNSSLDQQACTGFMALYQCRRCDGIVVNAQAPGLITNVQRCEHCFSVAGGSGSMWNSCRRVITICHLPLLVTHSSTCANVRSNVQAATSST
jgi:hypothetical protein